MSTAFIAILTTTAQAEINQWHDGDGNGSLWLSDAVTSPYIALPGELLWWADLEGTNIHHANFSFTNLAYANISYANVPSSDFSFANLNASNLEYSSFAYSSFRGSIMTSANIDNANLFGADFSDADLSDLEHWDNAFWIAAMYSSNTIFPDGMDPQALSMVEIETPTPGVLYISCIALFLRKRRQ